MTTAGPNLGGTIATSNPGGSRIDWTNPSNAAAEDGVFATIALDGVNLPYRMRASNFGFALPAGAVVSVMTREVKIKANSSPLVSDFSVDSYWSGAQRNDSGSIAYVTTTLQWIGNNAANYWPTATQANASDFGIYIDTTTNLAVVTYSVDAFRIALTYTVPVGGAYLRLPRWAQSLIARTMHWLGLCAPGDPRTQTRTVRVPA